MSPLGDQGGSVNQLIISCEAETPFKKGDPVVFSQNYKVRNRSGFLFGQAMSDAEEFQVFPVRVKGICRFEVSDTPSLLINKWRVDDKGKLVSDLTGKEVMVLYHKENRLDILL